MEIETPTLNRDIIFAETFDDYLQLVGEKVHRNIHVLQNLQKGVRERRLTTFSKIYNLRRKLRIETTEHRRQTNECIKKIPMYWGRILNVCDLNYNNIADANALKYLKEVQVEDLPIAECTLCDNETPALFALHKVRFIFTPNNLMENFEGVKTLGYKVCGWNNPEMEMLEPEVDTEIPIKWKPGKDPRVVKGSKKRKGIPQIGQTKDKIIPSFFHLFDDLKHEEEDTDYARALEKEKEEQRKMHFKILMGFVSEFVDRSIGYFDETIPNKALLLNPEDYDSDDVDVDEENEFIDGFMSEDSLDYDFDDAAEEERLARLNQPPDCSTQ